MNPTSSLSAKLLPACHNRSQETLVELTTIFLEDGANLVKSIDSFGSMKLIFPTSLRESVSPRPNWVDHFPDMIILIGSPNIVGLIYPLDWWDRLTWLAWIDSLNLCSINPDRLSSLLGLFKSTIWLDRPCCFGLCGSSELMGPFDLMPVQINWLVQTRDTDDWKEVFWVDWMSFECATMTFVLYRRNCFFF